MAYSKHQTVPLKTLTGSSFAVFKAIWGLSAADPESVGTQDVDQLIHENQRRPTAAILSDIPEIHQLGVTSSLWSLVQCVCVCEVSAGSWFRYTVISKTQGWRSDQRRTLRNSGEDNLIEMIWSSNFVSGQIKQSGWCSNTGKHAKRQAKIFVCSKYMVSYTCLIFIWWNMFCDAVGEPHCGSKTFSHIHCIWYIYVYEICTAEKNISVSGC